MEAGFPTLSNFNHHFKTLAVHSARAWRKHRIVHKTSDCDKYSSCKRMLQILHANAGPKTQLLLSVAHTCPSKVVAETLLAGI